MVATKDLDLQIQQRVQITSFGPREYRKRPPWLHKIKWGSHVGVDQDFYFIQNWGWIYRAPPSLHLDYFYKGKQVRTISVHPVRWGDKVPYRLDRSTTRLWVRFDLSQKRKPTDFIPGILFERRGDNLRENAVPYPLVCSWDHHWILDEKRGGARCGSPLESQVLFYLQRYFDL